MHKWFVTILVVAALCGGASFYYRSTQSKIEQLIQQNTALQGDVVRLIEAGQQNVKVIDQLQDAYEDIKADYAFIDNEFQLIRSQNRELDARFKRHDLSKLAAAKPELIEKIVNSASEDANRCFELLSGSPRTKKEMEAKNEKEFNSECPWLFDASSDSERLRQD